MIALIFPGAASARAVSRGLWLLTRPPEVNAGDVTTDMASVVVRADTTALLVIDPAALMPIPAITIAQVLDGTDASGLRGRLNTLLTYLLTNPATALPQIYARIGRGDALDLADLFPLIKGALKINPYVPPVVVGP